MQNAWPQCGENQSFVTQYSNSDVTREDHDDGTRGQMSGSPSTNSHQYRGSILPALLRTGYRIQESQNLPQSKSVSRHCIRKIKSKLSNQQASNMNQNTSQQAHTGTKAPNSTNLLQLLVNIVTSQTPCDNTPNGNNDTLPGRIDTSVINPDNQDTFIHKVVQHQGHVRQVRASHSSSAPPAVVNSPIHVSPSSRSVQMARHRLSSVLSTAPLTTSRQPMGQPNNQRNSSGTEINRIQHGVSLESGPPNPLYQHPSQPFNNQVNIVNAANGLSLPNTSQQSQYNRMGNFLSGSSQTHPNVSIDQAGHHYSQPNRPNSISHLVPVVVYNVKHPNVTYSGLPGPLPNKVGFGNALLSTTGNQMALSAGAGGQTQQHFTHQVSASTPEHYTSHNGPAVSTSNHGRQSSSTQDPRGQPPSYPSSQGYYVIVTEDKSGHGFRADNVIFMGNKPSESTLAIHGHWQGPSAGHVPSQDHNKINHNQLIIKPSESHNHKASDAGLKAIAVVQPQVSRTVNAKLASVTQRVTTTTDQVVSNPGKPCDERPQAGEDDIRATFLPMESGHKDPKIRLEELLPTDFNTEKVDSQILSNVEYHTSLTPHRKEINDIEINTQCLVNQSKEEINEKEGQVVSVEDTFESSVSVINWTVDKLAKLIDVLDKLTHDNSEAKVAKDIVDLFWGGSFKTLLQARGCMKDLNEEIKDFFRTHDTSTEPIILAQIKNWDQISDRCHVLKHNVFPTVVHKSSWLNTNKELDDIDKEFGFPLSLRNGLQTLQREEQPKLMGTEKDKSALSSSEKQNEVTTDFDPFSSLVIRVLPPEEMQRIFGAESMVTSECLKNDTLKDDLPEEMDVQSVEMASEDKVNDYCCLLQWLKGVNGSSCSLPCKCQGTIELSPGETVVNTVDSGEAIMVKEQCATKASQRESLHSSISNGSLSDTMEGKRIQYSGNDMNLLSLKSIGAEQCSGFISISDDENEIIMNPLSLKSIGAEQCSGFISISDDENEIIMNPLSLKSIGAEQCSGLISISDDENEIIHSSTGEGTESLPLPRPPSKALTITHQNIVEVVIDDVFSSFEDVLKMTTTISEPIIDSGLHKLPSKELPRPRQKPSDFEAFSSLRSSDLLPPNNFLESLSLRKKINKPLPPKMSSCENEKGLKRKRSLSIESPFPKKRTKKANVPAPEANLTKDCIKTSFVDEYNTDEPHTSGSSKSLEEKQPDATDLKKETETGYGTSRGKVSVVQLALFGSSPQRKNGTIVTGQRRDYRSSPSKLIFSDRGPMPPPTISVNVTSMCKPPLETSRVNVKQRIIRDWWNSHFDVATKKQRKSRKTSKIKKTSKIDDRRRLNRNVIIAEAPTKTPTPTNTDACLLSSEGGAVEHGTEQNKKPLGHAVKESVLNGLKLRLKRSQMRTVPSIKPDAVEKSKYEIGNPAVMSVQKSNVLRYSVLPESFSFEDEQETMDLQTSTDSTTEMTGSELPASAITKTFVKSQGAWSVETGNKYSPFNSSNVKVPKSTTTFQEYQKKYNDKTDISK